MIFKKWAQTIFGSSYRTSNEIRESILRNSISLLDKGFESCPVEVKLSSLPNAGQGVFSTKNIEKFSPLCFYPGIYTPPLPTRNIGHEGTNALIYLANKVVTENNAYVINLNDVGGSIDANNLIWDPQSDRCNPHAVGHFVNHGRQPNVNVISFHWNELLTRQNNFVSDPSRYHRIPNELRCDGSPWYFDTTSEEVIYLKRYEGHHEISIGGAVLYANTEIPEGSELFLDYMLQKPYPAWAREWYEIKK